jgi:peptidoglycan/xylan/chitin deacetylase (PgdA/CDA1 family)
LLRDLLAQVADGGVVILHDGDQGRGDRSARTHEASLTGAVIARLRERGYAFVRLDRLIAASQL